MAYQVLYRTYRPNKFSQVVGQEYIIKTLVNAINNKKIAHAYLFAGPRGTGKTTVAKLFAQAINCDSFNGEACDECENCQAYLNGKHPDIIEMDAASNNSVDDIREIVDRISYAPLLGKYKVYIIDEVHMLSTSAFNALLKTLEEPPAHVIFIFATTDPQKVIPTVLSRCQRYNFSKISIYEIKKRTIDVLKQENIPYNEKAIEEIARMAEGGMRDALSILEQCLAYNPSELKLEDVEKIFGLTSAQKEVELFLNIHDNQISDVINTIRNMYASGMDTYRLANDLLEICKDALIYSDAAQDNLLNRINKIEAQEIINKIDINTLLKDANTLEECISRQKTNQNFIVNLELAIIKMTNLHSNNKEETKTETNKEEKITKPATSEVTNKGIEQETRINLGYLLAILLDANRDLKINDQIIYNKLDLYLYEPDKRKFYQLLIGTEIFASNKDAIIVSGNRVQADYINSLAINEELYNFINTEFGIDKMIYAIDEEEKKELISRYKSTPAEKRNKPVYVEKYKTNKTESEEDKISNMFGDLLKVEE